MCLKSPTISILSSTCLLVIAIFFLLFDYRDLACHLSIPTSGEDKFKNLFHKLQLFQSKSCLHQFVVIEHLMYLTQSCNEVLFYRHHQKFEQPCYWSINWYPNCYLHSQFPKLEDTHQMFQMMQ